MPKLYAMLLLILMFFLLFFSLLQATYLPWAPGTLFGTGCLFACALLFLLPETRDQQLPQTMEDLKILQNTKKPQVEYVNMQETAPTT